ncbi:MAG: carboxypeptidase-like regulatory domain-containing protein [Verrucomicrobiota bacterium]
MKGLTIIGQRMIGFYVALTLSISVFSGLAQQPPNASNLWYNEFVFLPGGLRGMAKTITATNETFRQALLYVGAAQAGRTPPKLPDGLTQSYISNVEYQVFTWPLIVPPRPIEFYGRVVDEKGNPVTGAVAHFEWDGTVTNKNAMELRDWPKISTETTTDSNGLFSLTGKSGTQLDVSVGKTGYYSSRSNRGVQYFKYLYTQP